MTGARAAQGMSPSLTCASRLPSILGQRDPGADSARAPSPMGRLVGLDLNPPRLGGLGLGDRDGQKPVLIGGRDLVGVDPVGQANGPVEAAEAPLDAAEALGFPLRVEVALA